MMHKEHKSHGYVTVFLAIILAAFTAAVLSVLDAACSYAGGSIAENITAISGRSILSEFQPDLYKRYGLFALKNAESALKAKGTMYIEGSTLGQKGMVQLRLLSLDIDCSDYPFDDDELERQISKLSLGPNEYILSYCSSCFEKRDDTVRLYEVEYIICGGESDSENLQMIENRIFALRFAVHAVDPDDGMAADLASLAASAALGPGGEAAAEALAAAEAARRDVEIIMAGGRVGIGDSDDVGSYKDYLRVFLLSMSKGQKYQRLMDVIEDNLLMKDYAIFSFKEYVCGFDMLASYSRRNACSLLPGLRSRIVSHSFTYK